MEWVSFVLSVLAIVGVIVAIFQLGMRIGRLEKDIERLARLLEEGHRKE